MMLRESFALHDEARLLEGAVAHVWHQGWRTVDIAEAGCKTVGMKEMGNLISQAVIELSPRFAAPRAAQGAQ
jgi:3-isopropylmalate dehydrogenase